MRRVVRGVLLSLAILSIWAGPAYAQAMGSIYGPRPWVTGLKSYMGHTMGSCGVIETILTLYMMHEADVAQFGEAARPETLYRAQGCPACNDSGYQGRMGIYELLLVTEAVRPLIMNRSPASTIAQRAIDAIRPARATSP